jgi:hypothetical protein
MPRWPSRVLAKTRRDCRSDDPVAGQNADSELPAGGPRLLASLMAFWGFKRRLPSVASCLRVPRGQSFATERNTADHLHRRPSYRRHGSVDPLEKVGDGLMVVNHSGGLRAVGHSKVSIAVVPRARKIFEIREPFAGDEGPAEKNNRIAVPIGKKDGSMGSSRSGRH